MSVQGKVVIITGGAQGVGRYVARTFAAEGAKVAIADIAPMDTVVGEIEKLEGEVLPVKTNIVEESSVRSLMEQVYQKWGRIDVLINDAAIAPHFHIGAPRWPRIRDMDQNFFQKVMTTNLGGTFLCTKHALPYMESLNEGHIINFGQGGVLVGERSPGKPNIGMAVYNVSKVSIRAFTQHVADEEREFDICVVSMGPGAASSSTGPAPARGEWRPGGGGGLVTEDSPEWARDREWGNVKAIGNNYVLAAEAPMEFSGYQVAVRDGQLRISS